MTEILAGDDLWLPQTASLIKFREIRCQLARALEIDESTIRPETRLAAIVPPHRRAEILSSIIRPHHRTASENNLDRLPGWLIEILATAVFSLLCLFQPWFLALLTLPVTILIAKGWRSPQSTIWPNCFETMQELAISQTHYTTEDAANGLWPREEISAKVRWIIANQTGVGFDEVTEETSIIELC